MKQVVKLIGCIALMAVIGLALSCKQEEEEDRSSTLSAPDISSTPDFPRDVDVEFVSSYYEALTLFNSISYTLSQQLEEAFDDAIAAVFSKDKITGPNERRSITLRIPNGYPIPAIDGATIDGGISSATISTTEKQSGSATFNITKFTAAGGDTIQAAGVAKVSERVDYKPDVEESREKKYAFALTVYNTTTRKCAKFRFACTENTIGNDKSGRNFLETTTVEVYNRSDTKVYELNEVRSSGLFGNSGHISGAAASAVRGDWY
jgi:hypothetical protein